MVGGLVSVDIGSYNYEKLNTRNRKSIQPSLKANSDLCMTETPHKQTNLLGALKDTYSFTSCNMYMYSQISFYTHFVVSAWVLPVWVGLP